MTRKHTKKAATSKPSLAPEHTAQAFEAVKDEILAVPEWELSTINLDIPRAAGRGASVAERIAPLLPALSALPGLDLPRVQRIGLYALALHHAHDLATEVGAEEVVLQTLLEEARPLREGMLRSAELLVLFGVFSAERVAAIRSGQGHADTADDAIALGRLFDEKWPWVDGKVPVTREMVDRAPVLGAKIHKALAQRELAASPLMPPSDRRYLQAQAFTLFVRAYDETRRGVTYLRWHEGDADKIVPSLYQQRSRRSGMVQEVGSEAEPEAADETGSSMVVPEAVVAEEAAAMSMGA